jgi:hypothetical protein
MKKRITFLILAIVSLSIGVFSQSVNYKVEKDDPEDNHKLYLTVKGVGDMWGRESILLGYGFEAKYFIFKRLTVEGLFNKGIYSNGDTKPYGVLPYGMEVMGQFAFSSKIKTKTLKVNMSAMGGQHIKVEGKKMSNWTVRGGFMSHNSAGVNQRLVSMTGLAFGIGHLGWSNLQLRTDRYGKRYSSTMINTYLDIIYATSININNDSNAYYYTYDKESPFGWRFGIQIYSNISRTLSLFMKSEIGNRPGVKEDSSVPDISFEVGFNIQLL